MYLYYILACSKSRHHSTTHKMNRHKRHKRHTSDTSDCKPLQATARDCKRVHSLAPIALRSERLHTEACRGIQRHAEASPRHTAQTILAFCHLAIFLDCPFAMADSKMALISIPKKSTHWAMGRATLAWG